jgi:hypothetical protein
MDTSRVILHRSACSSVLLLGVLAALVLAPASQAADADPSSAPVAIVDGVTITLGQVEDALLKKEGSDGLTDWVQSHLAKLDWSKIKDTDPILRIGGTTVTRRDLVLQLLKPTRDNGGYAGSGGKARDDLINSTVVKSAILKAHITLDQQDLDAAWSSMERQFEAGQQESKQRMEFSSYIRTKEGMDEEEFRRQPGFLMLAGLRKLTIKQALEHVVEADVMTYFDDHRERWDVQPAVRLADIYEPFFSKDQGSRDTQMGSFLTHYQGLMSKSEDFATDWLQLSKAWDPEAGAGGDLGWVSADGSRQSPTARRLPHALMSQAFGVKHVPWLLMPCASELGIDLVRVDAQRPGSTAVYKDVRERVLMDMLESQLQERMAQTMHDLRVAAEIRFLSLPDAVDRLTSP